MFLLFLFSSCSLVPKRRKISSFSIKDKIAQANLSRLVNNRQPIACVGVYLITVYAELNDLNVDCNHLSWQQLISYRARDGGGPFQLSQVMLQFISGMGEGKCIHDKKGIMLSGQQQKTFIRRVRTKRMRFKKERGRAKSRLNHN